ncbi:hypothetical protein ZIOFF_034852 [Zingiber officinale]|uniref:Uncharacterized protein n=1 Tax=Zingiber officinale TaxID=94328 RepID=A0A8J5KX39_ZINOF|nr:hypothetical protein ZIOFF_034852 [Zingiber officinale]
MPMTVKQLTTDRTNGDLDDLGRLPHPRIIPSAPSPIEKEDPFCCRDNGLLCCLLPCRFHCLSAARSLSRSLHPRLSAVIHPPCLRNVISERTAWSLPCTAYFSSVTTKPASDSNLLQGVDSEIKCALESDGYDRVALAFLYSEEKLSSRESIEVIVSMPSLVAGEELDNEPDNNDEDGDQSERPSQSSIPLTVVVSKGIKERG